MKPLLNRESVSAALESHGISSTAQRLDIGCVLLERAQHLSAEQVIERLRERGKRVSKATVYNTLHLFVECGLLRAISLDPTRLFYDSRSEPHHHFYNVDTGELTDIPLEAIQIGDLPALPEGTKADGVHVVVSVRDIETRQA